MLRHLVVIILFTSIPQWGFSQTSIDWLTFEEAQKRNAEEPRKILVDFYTVWCGPCKMMTRNTFGNEEVAQYVNENFYAVKFNAQGNDSVNFKGEWFTNPGYDPARARGRNANHQMTLAMALVNQQLAFPTVVYLDSEWRVVSPVQGYLSPSQIEPILKYVIEEKYKDTPWEEYQSSFSGSW
jgi:thioredoxin-related protein